jgi:hypothetical protein
MARYVSRDRHWRVTSILLDGHELLRVETDQPVMPVGEPAGRTGPIQGPGGWFKQEDVRSAAEVERYLPFHELEEEAGK